MRWTVKGYAIRNGQSVVDEWLDHVADEAAAKFEQRLDFMRSRKVTEWPYNYAHKRVGSSGLWEVKFEANKIAYRPLFFLGPDVAQITFLIFSEERNNVLKPVGAEGTAKGRMQAVTSDPKKAIVFDD